MAGDALVVGGSAVAAGLLADPGVGAEKAAAPGRPSAPGLVLAGSCSAATLGQVERHRTAHPALAPEEMEEPEAAAARALAFLGAARDGRPLVFSSAPPEAVARAQGRWGREALARRLDGVFAAVARAALDRGFGALMVAGGETSGAVAQALGAVACGVGAEVAPGVPTLYPEDGRCGLVLKSGNFGGPAFFEEALDALEAGR